MPWPVTRVVVETPVDVLRPQIQLIFSLGRAAALVLAVHALHLISQISVILGVGVQPRIP